MTNVPTMSTPPKSTKDNDETSFSPIKTPVSQYGSHGRGNLTGSLRKVKDTAADVHNAVLKWNKLNADGMNIINQIANIKLEKVFNHDVSEDGPEVCPLPTSLEPQCQLLSAVVHNMRKVADKMHQLKMAMDGLQVLLKHQGEEADILFQTWTIHDFVRTVSQIEDMYLTELKLKQSIAENVAHGKDRNTMMFYSAAWVHQPYIDQSATVLLDSLLVETGHK